MVVRAGRGRPGGRDRRGGRRAVPRGRVDGRRQRPAGPGGGQRGRGRRRGLRRAGGTGTWRISGLARCAGRFLRVGRVVLAATRGSGPHDHPALVRGPVGKDGRPRSGAEVDGIDGPAAADLDTISTIPELAILPRPGLATAYLGFGSGSGSGRPSVRRAFAQGVDRTALAAGAFAAGRQPQPTTWPRAPSRAAAPARPGTTSTGRPGARPSTTRASTGRPRSRSTCPDGPVPGIADPSAARRRRSRRSSRTSLGVKVRHRRAARRGARQRQWPRGASTACTSPASRRRSPTPPGYLGPLFAPRRQVPHGRPRAQRQPTPSTAPRGVTDPAEREAALGEANDALRAAAPIVAARPPGHDDGLARRRAGRRSLAHRRGPARALRARRPQPGRRRWAPPSPTGRGAGRPPRRTRSGCAPSSRRACYGFDGATLRPGPGARFRLHAVRWRARSGRAGCGRRRGSADGARLDAGDVLAIVPGHRRPRAGRSGQRCRRPRSPRGTGCSVGPVPASAP